MIKIQSPSLKSSQGDEEESQAMENILIGKFSQGIHSEES